jgi:FrmR/RcnR family transcriptional regulator, repressor of frmRAB operon
MPDPGMEKEKLIKRVHRILDQVEAIERPLEQDAGCSNMLRLVVSVRGAISTLMAEVLEEHIRMQVVDPLRRPDPTRALAAEELIEVVQCYLK